MKNLPHPSFSMGARAGIVIAAAVVAMQVFHLFSLSAARRETRAAVLDAARSELPLPDRAQVIARAFDEGTRWIYVAASGPYVLLIVLVPFLLARAGQLERRVGGAEEAISSLGARRRGAHYNLPN